MSRSSDLPLVSLQGQVLRSADSLRQIMRWGPQVEQVGHPFFVFRDKSSDQVRVLYKRKTRGYGVIVPQLQD